jgi:hypothetical protein
MPVAAAHARPILVYPDAGGDPFIGTGFFAQVANGGLVLVTAAHVPTRTQPTSDFTKWPERLSVINTENSQVVLELFQPGHATRLPLFKYFASAGAMADMMALPLPPAIVAIGKFNLSPAVDLRTVIEQSHPLGPVSGFGYPSKGPNTPWPYTPADETKGQLLDTSGMMITATMKTIEGHSGGPVFGSGDSFVGMMIGSNGVAKIVSNRLLSALVNDKIQVV